MLIMDFVLGEVMLVKDSTNSQCPLHGVHRR
jgi:hypothetical protein